MAKLQSKKDRTVLELVAEFDPSKASSLSLPSSSSVPFRTPSLRSLAISYASDSETLIYIGTDAGTLIFLSLNASSVAGDEDGRKSSNPTLSFSRSIVVSNCLVDSIHVFVEIVRILLVSDGFLFLVDSHLLQSVRRLSFLRGVSVVAPRLCGVTGSSISDLVVDGVHRSESSSAGQRFLHKLGGGIRANGVKSRESEFLKTAGTCVVSVAIGKRLILIELLPGGAGGLFVVLKEIQAFEGVRAMVWIGDTIIVGTAGGYTQFSCVTGQFTPMFSLPGPSSPPCLKCLPKDHEALLLIDYVGILVNALGQPVVAA